MALLLTLAVMAACLFLLAVGVIFSRKKNVLLGHCGGKSDDCACEDKGLPPGSGACEDKPER